MNDTANAKRICTRCLNDPESKWKAFMGYYILGRSGIRVINRE